MEEGASPFEALVRDNVGIVVHEARRYDHLGLPREDLVAEGCVGLIEAARRFDAGRGIKFVTYAVWWIRRFILKSLGEQSTVVKIPYLQKKRLREIRETERLLARQLARRPDREEIALQLAAEVSEADIMFARGLRELRLDERIGPNADRSVAESLATSDDSVEDHLLRQEIDTLLEGALGLLTDQQREVLHARYGLKGRNAETLRQVGSRLQLSGERVRQIERHAKRRLRCILTQRLTGPRRPPEPVRGPSPSSGA